MLKSSGVVAAAYILAIALVLASDPLIAWLFPHDFVRGRIPSNAALATSSACFAGISILCAWLCARWAPSRPARHMLWLLLIGEIIGIAATVANWSKGWPHWYGLSWLLIWPACCWIGFLLSARASKSSPADVVERN